MRDAIKRIHRPVFFFQAANDYNLSPSKELSSEIRNAGKIALLTIYPSFGSSVKAAHSFPYRGVRIWFNDVISFLNKYCSIENGKIDRRK